MDVNGRGRLLTGVIVVLVQRKCKHRRVACEDSRGTVSMMYVAIHHQGPRDRAFLLQSANLHRDVVNSAEAFTMTREGMVKSAADIETNAIAQRIARGQNSSSGSQPESLYHRAGVGNFELQQLGVTQSPGLQAVNPT